MTDDEQDPIPDDLTEDEPALPDCEPVPPEQTDEEHA